MNLYTALRRWIAAFALVGFLALGAWGYLHRPAPEVFWQFESGPVESFRHTLKVTWPTRLLTFT